MESVLRIIHFISLIWITGIVEQQYAMTAITDIKFHAGPKLDMESHKALFWDIYFYSLYNELPKIINNTSAPMIFADDTIILFAHSNIIDYNIHIVSETLNKWFKANQLSLNFNTFAASYLNTQGLNNSCLKSPASTLVDLTFQSRALRSFSLNQLRNLSL